MNNIIEIKGLEKSFGNIKAVDGLSFNVRKGQLFAFLGINGAGKSTAINIICGQLEKDKGSVTVDGLDIDKGRDGIKSKIGVFFQNSYLDKALTVRDNLESRAALYGIHGKAFEKRLEELADTLCFGDLLNRTLGRLSGGQRRRIDIARALLHDPKILILDEPTTGLDPQTRKILWDVIEELRKKENMTVFLTTHYMEEADSADHVVILDGGKKIAEGSPLELKNKYSSDCITIYGLSEEDIKSIGAEYTFENNICPLTVSHTAEATELILKHPSLFKDYEITKGKMDDVFLNVTGKTLGGGNFK